MVKAVENKDAQTAPTKTSGIRLGQISFINCLPVVLPLERGLIKVDADVVYAAPAKLNSLFAANELDLSAMSSFFYLEQKDLTLAPSLSIASIGAVGSVLFFCKNELNKLTPNCKLVATEQSATSVNLLRILFDLNFGFVPHIEIAKEPDLEGTDYEGALVIGDKALAKDLLWHDKYERIDLGKWWHDTTALPMVFGVWAARNSWLNQHQQQWQALADSLLQAKELGLTNYLPQVIEEASKRTGLTAKRLKHYYLNELNFELSPEHIKGLMLYQQHAIRLGLLTKDT